MADQRVTSLLCPDCSGKLVIKPGGIRTQDGMHLRCMSCMSAWVHEPRRRASDRYRVRAGALALLLISALATASWTGATSVCVEIVENEGATCVQRPVVGTWEYAEHAALFGFCTAILAAVFITYRVGWRVLRGDWWRISQGGLLLGIGIGAVSGTFLTRQWAPEFYWENPDFWFELAALVVIAALVICLTSFAATGRAVGDETRWDLVQVFPEHAVRDAARRDALGIWLPGAPPISGHHFN